MNMRPLRAAPSFALLAATVCGLVACQKDTSYAPGSAVADPILRENYPKVEALDGLAGYIAVSGVNVVPATSGTPLSVTCGVRALSDTALAVQYRFFFLDATGNPMNVDPDWQYMSLGPRTLLYMQGNALDTRAVDWRLQIRPAR